MEELLSRCPRWVLPGPGSPALCAVSGGLDSMCLLDLLDRWCRKRDGRVVAAHFNHRLRGAEADRDETFVRDWCAAHDIAFVSSSGDVRGLMEREGLSLEEAARKLRYDFLRQEAEKLGQHIKIYTAHHADDNAETILFNLIRGTGVAGLTGMAYQQNGICRPLLDVTREELAAYAAARHIPQGQRHFLLLLRGEDGIAESLRQSGSFFHSLAQSTQRRSIAFQFRHARLFSDGKERRGITPGHDIANHCSTTLVNDLSISF